MPGGAGRAGASPTGRCSARLGSARRSSAGRSSARSGHGVSVAAAADEAGDHLPEKRAPHLYLRLLGERRAESASPRPARAPRACRGRSALSRQGGFLPSPQVSGIVLLAVGVWGRVSLAVYFSLLDEKATNVPFVLMGAGVVVVLLGTFGCFATCRGSTWMLKLVGAAPRGRRGAVPVGAPDPSHSCLLPAVRHAAVPHLPHRAGGCRRRVCFQA